tara:strand:+ start:116 stop:1135 length:1020 start_codon:yes stop_codon:yes gene_type:complete
MDDHDQGNSGIEVPEHILDKVQEIAEFYVQRELEAHRKFKAGDSDTPSRWLDGFSDEEQAYIIENSGYNNHSEERRELRRKILQQAVAHIAGDIPERAMLFYVGGPQGTGKKEIRSSFDKRIEEEQSQGIIRPFENDHLETVFQKYKQAKSRLMGPDYDVFRAELPEYLANKEEHGHDFAFALIRAEATGLGAAIKAWAEELKAHVILEELGDGLTDDWLSRNKVEEKELIVVGTTADPVLAKDRLVERQDSADEDVLAKQFSRFSEDDGYPKWANEAELAVLVKTDDGTPHVIHAANYGRTLEEDPLPVSTFNRYSEVSVQEMFTPKAPDAQIDGLEF